MTKLTPRARRRQIRELARPAQNRESIPSPAGEQPQGLRGQLRPHGHLDDIRHQLRQELGREPTPQEIRAWFESQWKPTDLAQMLVDGVREMLGPLPSKPPSRWRILVQRLLHPWRAVPVARPGHRL
jgi:hypothetical protein